MVISASRRTDIPAYYAEWFLARLAAGSFRYPNPVSGAPVEIDCTPSNVEAFVFWTRNPAPFWEALEEVDRRYEGRRYMHFTINGMPRALEPRNPATDEAIATFRRLADRFGDDYAIWRYDPIVLSDATPPERAIETFSEIAARLEGATHECVVSFVRWYRKTRRNAEALSRRTGVRFREPSAEEKAEIARELRRIAEARGITLKACAEEDAVVAETAGRAACIDPERINRLTGAVKKRRVVATRPGCLCVESRDIGYYDSCPHGCVYCYSNDSPEKALANARRYRREGFPLG